MRRFSGASTGAITAALLALGYTCDQLQQLSANTLSLVFTGKLHHKTLLSNIIITLLICFTIKLQALSLILRHCWLNTVQTFNSYTRQTVVFQCLVVQTPMDNISKKAKHIDEPCSLRIKAFSCEVIHTSMPRKLSRNRMCSCVSHPDCICI